jgi:predicted esterase
MLHGTGGNEEDLLPLGRLLSPGAALLAPRGKVLEKGMPRYFRRLAEGVFDLEDLRFRTDELADFITSGSDAYGLTGGVVAAGFSNGANIGASLVLRKPGLLRGAILLRPMVPFVPDELPDLGKTPVWIGVGKFDPVARPEEGERLADLLRRGRADVTVHSERAGHTVTMGDVEAARAWLERLP